MCSTLTTWCMEQCRNTRSFLSFGTIDILNLHRGSSEWENLFVKVLPEHSQLQSWRDETHGIMYDPQTQQGNPHFMHIWSENFYFFFKMWLIFNMAWPQSWIRECTGGSEHSSMEWRRCNQGFTICCSLSFPPGLVCLISMIGSDSPLCSLLHLVGWRTSTCPQPPVERS